MHASRARRPTAIRPMEVSTSRRASARCSTRCVRTRRLPAPAPPPPKPAAPAAATEPSPVEADPPAVDDAPRVPAAPPAAQTPADRIRRRRDALLEPLVPEVVRVSKRLLQDEQNSLLDAARRARGRHDPARLLPEHVRRARHVDGPPRAVDRRRLPRRSRLGGKDGTRHERAGASRGRAHRAPGLTAARARHRHHRERHQRGPVRVGERAATSARIRDRSAVPRVAHGRSRAPCGGRARGRLRPWRVRHVPAPAAMLEWVPADPGRCPDCDDNALEPTLKGKAFPTGQQHPPAHPGCRCLVVPMEA